MMVLVIYYRSCEASFNGTWLARDSIPKDIIICDWHYSLPKKYPSIDLFLEKGFRVISSSYQDIEETNSFISYSYSIQDFNLLCHMLP